jgi:hypothetical protein
MQKILQFYLGASSQKSYLSPINMQIYSIINFKINFNYFVIFRKYYGLNKIIYLKVIKQSILRTNNSNPL